MKKALCILGALLLAAAAGAGIRAAALYGKAAAYRDRVFPPPENCASLERVTPEEICYLFDPNDLRLMAGHCDRIAAAYVREVAGTSYENVEIGWDGALSGTPYTHYGIEILYGIKGPFGTETEEVVQYGGVSIDQTRVEEIAPLLEAGRCYVLYLRDEAGGTYVEKACGIAGVRSREDYLAARAETGDGSLLAEHLEAFLHEDRTYAPVR